MMKVKIEKNQELFLIITIISYRMLRNIVNSILWKYFNTFIYFYWKKLSIS